MSINCLKAVEFCCCNWSAYNVGVNLTALSGEIFHQIENAYFAVSLVYVSAKLAQQMLISPLGW